MQETDLTILKEKIDIVQYIGQFVELKFDNGEWWGLCPLHQEKTPSFSVSGDKGSYFCHGCKSGGSIIDFAINYHHIGMAEAIEKLAEEYKIPRNHIPTIIRVCKKFISKESNCKDVIRMEYLRNPMLDYVKEPIEEWIKEGILQSVMDKFDVRYDIYNQNIVFPIIDHLGNIVSIKARTLSPNKTPKYHYYTKIGTVNFLYGYFQNQEAIKEKNEMIIFEGEKSVMKAEGYGYLNTTASMTDRIENSVENIIVLPCKDIIIAWDKGISKSQVLKEVKKLKKYKNVFMIEDKWGLLENKDAPVDKGKEVFDILYSRKERIL